MASNKKVIVVGVDDSQESFYSLEWTLDHLLTPLSTTNNNLFKLIIIHAKISALSVIHFSGPGDILPQVEADLKKTASRIVDKAHKLCKNRSISDFQVEVCEGDPRNVLCEAVENHRADILVVGSHGYGAIKRAILGSVSDYCTHHVHCTVLIVKKPKINR
ncbi:PREDICTED: universal stress protein A-like protein [Nelumbo nucifera]|uniref:UspA domain-containing protein n=2 Tax=Nelumbo nucifera TaxID=4432 RepID=A0A822YC77_NELNU|nr:PREDICTED: universal stress protein A-like protein [Nelumbo nucifera]DAD30190.1 TPA_asm: hypothetical protein HUJ06_031658 [Nelumbo nucifera]